jgi:arginine exporter protein ArgO
MLKKAKNKYCGFIFYNRSIYIFKKIYLLFLFCIYAFFSYFCNSENKQMKYEINLIFKKLNKININDIYEKYYPTKKNKNEIIKSEINIEFTLDPNYILETMLTITSIMASQKNTTKIVFHFGVINRI